MPPALLAELIPFSFVDVIDAGPALPPKAKPEPPLAPTNTPSHAQEAPVAAALPGQVQVMARPALPLKVKPASQPAQIYRHRTYKKP